MFEQNFEHEDRYNQQGRRHGDRRNTSRGYMPDDDRYENLDRYRSRGQDFYRGQEQSRRYTRPDYDSDLEIERPGQPRFSSRGSYNSSHDDYGREYGRDFGRGEYGRDFGRGEYGRDFGRDQSREFGRDQSRDFGRDQSRDYSRDSSRDFSRDYDNESSDRWSRQARPQQRYQERNEPRYRSDAYRDWEDSSIGHADWGGRSESNQPRPYDQSWSRGSSDQQSRFIDQKSRWPKNFKRNDERLKDDIHEELIRHGGIDASDIEVQVKDGEVTLVGQVSGRQDKRLAEELAEKVLGVHEVQNQLKVKQQNQAQDPQRSGSPSLPGSNRASPLGTQQDQSKVSNSTSK